MYRDKRGWTYMVGCRFNNAGEKVYIPTFLNKGNYLYHFKKIRSCHEWPTKEQAEKEMKEYAEARGMKAVI
jgi:hypothetical protein